MSDNCTIRKEAWRLDDKRCHENRMCPLSGHFHLTVLKYVTYKRYDAASRLMLTDPNLPNNLSFLSNRYLESMTITHREGKFGFWLGFSLESVGLYLYRVFYDVVDQIVRYDRKPHY